MKVYRIKIKDFYWLSLGHLNETFISIVMTLLGFYGFRILYGRWLPYEFEIYVDVGNSRWLITGKFVPYDYWMNY